MQRLKYLTVIFSLIFLLSCTACAVEMNGGANENGSDSGSSNAAITSDESATREIFAMDTYMTVTAYGENAEEAVELAQEEIERLDALLSTGEETSEVSQINENGSGTLSEDCAYLLERSLEMWESTGGVFDIAIYPIMEAWGFTGGEYRVPSQEEIDSLLPLIDVSNITYDEEASLISFGVEEMEIDFGAVAKGYTSSRVMDIFQECGVTSGMINLGGNVQVLGTKTDGSSWKVAIQDPDGEEGYDYIGIVSVADQAVITSGGYERYFEEDGVTYHHIIDPTTGYPSDSGLTSVSIVSTDGTLADMLSTSCFIMGEEAAVSYWRAHSEEFDMILYTEDGRVIVTEGISDSFTSDQKIEIVSAG